LQVAVTEPVTVKSAAAAGVAASALAVNNTAAMKVFLLSFPSYNDPWWLIPVETGTVCPPSREIGCSLRTQPTHGAAATERVIVSWYAPAIRRGVLVGVVHTTVIVALVPRAGLPPELSPAPPGERLHEEFPVMSDAELQVAAIVDAPVSGNTM
jgi:hypothetical protein